MLYYHCACKGDKYSFVLLFCLRAEMQAPVINSRQDSSLRAAPARSPPEGLNNALVAFLNISASVHLCNIVVLVRPPDSSESERAPSPVRRSESPSYNSDHRSETPPLTYIYIIHTYNS